MSVTDIQIQEDLAHDDHYDDHHEQGFVSKYIFTTDHKPIAKQ